MIFIMMIIGAITRLTGSGLSIVEWNVIMGAVPPLNQEQWQQAFDQYKQFPQYKKVNTHMDLAGFKNIYFWEYFHRLWGRLIGIVFAVPFIYFLIRKRLNSKLTFKLLMACILGGLQGLIGWIMVKSGLNDQPWVSPYKLTAHLLMALLLYGYLFWMALQLLYPNKAVFYNRTLKRMAYFVLVLVIVQITFGGFMSGLKAALFYPTFPTMNGQFVPAGMWDHTPLWKNIFDNPTTVQFIHRSLAYIITLVIIFFSLRARQVSLPKIIFMGINLLLLALLIQFLLGIFTVINSKGSIPIVLGVLHQAGAVMLFTAILFVTYFMSKDKPPRF